MLAPRKSPGKLAAYERRGVAGSEWPWQRLECTHQGERVTDLPAVFPMSRMGWLVFPAKGPRNGFLFFGQFLVRYASGVSTCPKRIARTYTQSVGT